MSLTLDEKLEAITGMDLKGCIAFAVVLIIYLGMFAVIRIMVSLDKRKNNAP